MNEKENDLNLTLNKIEKIMLEELEFYSDKEQTINAKSSRLAVTDKMCKSANVILSIENLKERRYMNRTERKKENRMISQSKN